MPIQFKEMCFGFDELEKPLFQQVNLMIDTTWRLGLVGRNGRGKTTLLKLLMQQYPHSGEITSTEEFVYFPLKINHPETLTYYAIEEIMDVELWQLERECHLLNLDKEVLWQPFEQLSGGEQTKVLLATLFCDEARFALLDEPTNHLDRNSRATVAKYLQQKNGYIIVSHDQSFLDQVIDHVLVLEKSNLAVFKGDYSTYLAQKELQDQFELAQNKSINKEINRLKATAKEKANWADSREKPSGNDPFGNAIAKRMNKRAKAIEGRTTAKIEAQSKLLHNIETVNALSINSMDSHRNPLIRVKNLTLSFQGKRLFEPITFELFKGEQVAIVGPNGSGKTMLLQFLLSQHFEGTIEGDIQLSSSLATSTIRQKYDDNKGGLKDFAQSELIDYTMFLNHLRILGMERDVFQVTIERMSNGQRKKVEFAKSLGKLAELYVWDEPLNYLDLYNKQQIEAMIQTFKPTLLFVEHDQSFVEAVATKIIELK